MAYMIIMGVFTLIFLCVGLFIGYIIGNTRQDAPSPIDKIKAVFTAEPDMDPIQVDDEREYEIEQERNGR